jgi:hypothetical protein
MRLMERYGVSRLDCEHRPRRAQLPRLTTTCHARAAERTERDDGSAIAATSRVPGTGR